MDDQADIVKALVAAKRHSDARRYRAKAAILRKLFVERPDDFVIDSPDPRYPGITHAPTGFRIHAPAAVAAPIRPQALLKAAMIKAEGDKWVLWTADGKRRLGTHDTKRKAAIQEWMILKSKGKSEETEKRAAAPRWQEENEAFERAVEAMPEGKDKERAKRGHGVRIGSCGHRIGSCRCPSRMHNISLTLDIPCESCAGQQADDD